MSLPEAKRTTDSGAFRLAATTAGALSAQGPLTFVSARRAYELGVQALAQVAGSTLEIDCRGITVSDSAGLAVLLEWLGVARRAGRSLRYTQLPEGLAALARISEVQELLERGV
jgi:phospholipid transport system transporter-binding protein